MIFMSQSGLTDPDREAAWDAWYAEHLRIMTTVPGITSAQRFRTTGARYSPSLAMYTVASPDVFGDPYYLSVRASGRRSSTGSITTATCSTASMARPTCRTATC